MIKRNLLLIVLLFATAQVALAQVSKEQAVIALERILKSETNHNFKKQITEDIDFVRENIDLIDASTYDELAYAYERLTMIYNRIYLAEIKMDLTSYRQLKKLGKKPEKKAAKYAKNYQLAVDHYTMNINPIINALHHQSKGMSADIDPNVFDSLQLVEQQQRIRSSGIQDISSTIGIVSSAFAVVTSITAIIADKKRRNQEIIREFISEANYMFEDAQLLEFRDLDISRPGGSSESYSSSSESESSASFTSNEVPIDYAYGDPISGSLFFEYFDNTINEDRVMHIIKGRSQEMIVNENEISLDLIVKKKPGAKKKKAKTHATPFVTSGSYGNGTFYRVRSEGNGYVYVFAINSDQSMYSIFPFEGGTEDMPEGLQYAYPENAIFTEEPSGMVQINIPDGEYYIEISDSPGKPAPVSETMIVLISRPQLDMRDIMGQMESMGSHLSPEERLFNIFGSLSANVENGNVDINDGTLYYDLNGDDNVVLPLVFGIKRH